jgi:molybdopterin-guanine dinucleotide biosynthesis protein A
MTHADPAIAGLVLAGGRATRMGGRDKPLLLLGGRPLVAHVAARLAPQVGRLAISASGDPARFAGLGLPVLPDAAPDFAGPLAGILAGLDWAAELGLAAVVSAAADTPFLPRDLVARLRAAAGGGPAFAAAGADRHPTAGLWPVALRGALREALGRGERRVGAWAVGQGACLARFDDPAAFFNVNRPEDLAAAEAMLRDRG